MVVAGTYLTIFSWLIYLTWRVHDWTVAASITGFVPVLSVLSFFRHRQESGAAAVRVSYGFIAWCCVLVVALINFRLDGLGCDAIRLRDFLHERGDDACSPLGLFPCSRVCCSSGVE